MTGCSAPKFSEGFEIIQVHGEVPDVGLVLGEIKKDHINVLFDCTSMSQQWYYEFFRWLGEGQEAFETATLRFVYTMTGFVDEESPKKVKRVKEFLKTEYNSKKNKKALFLGLGHEANVSDAIYKIVKPDLVYLFYTDPPVDKRFVELILVNNHALINATPIRNLIAYPITNGQLIYQTLIDTILPLRNEYNIVIVPQGPKIFSVASMLVHLGYPDTVISYPMFKRPKILDRVPCGDPVVLDITL